MASVVERVTRGAALLDERRPGWWRTDAPVAAYIDLDKLNIDDCEDCVLGQLYRTAEPGGGDYTSGLRELGIAVPADYGFIAYISLSDADWAAEPDLLQAEWALLIAARRDAASVAVANG